MNDRFENSGEDGRNAGQGDRIGRLERLNNKLHWLRQHPEVTWSGTGIYVVSIVVAAMVAVASWYFWPQPPQTNTISVEGGNSGTAVIAGGDVTVNNPNVPPELLAQYAEELGATRQLINSFFGTLLKEKVPRDQWDSKLREIAATHKELLARLDSVRSEDPQVLRLKAEARQAIEAGEYGSAEDLLNRAEDLDLKAIEQMEKTTRQRRISAADTNVTQALAQRIQLRYAKAAAYWQKAAALLPEDKKKDRAFYLNAAGYDLSRLARSVEAQPLYEQSLSLYREIGDRAGEGTTLTNIGALHHAKGDYGTALKYLEQSLVISREGGNRAGEGTTLNNISGIHWARGDYSTALKYLEQSLVIFRETGSKSEEGTTLNNISQIYDARGDYGTALKYLEQSLVIHREVGNRAVEGTTLSNIGALHHAKGDYGTALKYLEQSLVISQEIGDRRGEAETSWNIGRTYEEQGDLAKAEQYISRAVQLAEEIGHPSREKCREHLEAVRAKLKGR
jgi:tetratricopeptide (TPR) repeat protein